MPDIEKVIKGLECCYNRTDDPQTIKCLCSDCQYNNDDITGRRCHIELCEDALELLKEQRRFIKFLYNVIPDEMEAYLSMYLFLRNPTFGERKEE